MRTFTAAIGLIGVLVSQAALAQEPAPGACATQPPPAEAPPPPPAVAAPGTARRAPTPFGAAADRAARRSGASCPGAATGIGARYMIPLPITPAPHPHQVPRLLGAGVRRRHPALQLRLRLWARSGYSYSWTEIVPVVGMMWQVWFTDSFAVYPKIELGYAFGWYSDTNGATDGPVGREPLLPRRHRRLLYKLGNGITLRAEAGYVGGKAGVAWLF